MTAVATKTSRCDHSLTLGALLLKATQLRLNGHRRRRFFRRFASCPRDCIGLCQAALWVNSGRRIRGFVAHGATAHIRRGVMRHGLAFAHEISFTLTTHEIDGRANACSDAARMPPAAQCSTLSARAWQLTAEIRPIGGQSRSNNRGIDSHGFGESRRRSRVASARLYLTPAKANQNAGRSWKLDSAVSRRARFSVSASEATRYEKLRVSSRL